MTERIEQVREDLNLSAMAFCKRIGFPYARYHHIIGGRKSKPTADLLTLVTEHTRANPDWLLRGRGPVYRKEEDEFEGDRGFAPGLGGDYVLLPLYSVQGSAGDGGLNGPEEVEDLLAFKREWITRELRASPEALSLIYVQGESMVPTLNPGDVILVERNNVHSVSDGIFVIRMGEALLVKRLQFLPDAALNVTSDNPAYAPFKVSLKEPAEDFGIIGRVVWAGRRF